MGLDLAGARVGHLQGDRADGAVHGFLQRDEDVALDVAALALAGGGGPLAAFRESVAAATAEELLEEVAEAGAAEVELVAAAGRCGTAPAVARLAGCPSRLPSWSYFFRFSGSLSTSLASLISLNFSSAVFLSLATSGWCLRASLRNAFLMSAQLASRGTPRMS